MFSVKNLYIFHHSHVISWCIVKHHRPWPSLFFFCHPNLFQDRSITIFNAVSSLKAWARLAAAAADAAFPSALKGFVFLFGFSRNSSDNGFNVVYFFVILHGLSRHIFINKWLFSLSLSRFAFALKTLHETHNFFTCKLIGSSRSVVPWFSGKWFKRILSRW